MSQNSLGIPAVTAARLYAAITDDDTATVARVLHPSVRMRVPGSNPLSGTYIGVEGLQAFISRAVAIAPGGAHTTVSEVMAGDSHAAVLGMSRARRAGHADLENRTLHLLAVIDGQITEVNIFNFDQGTVDRFWS